MTRLLRSVFHLMLVALATGFASQTAEAQAPSPKSQDPVSVDPKHYQVLYEDVAVRVLRYDDTPGHVVPLHTHQHPYKVYVVSNATREFLSLDNTGKECQKTAPPTKLMANDELMRGPITHCEANTGNTPTHLIIFEYKNWTWTTPPAGVARRRRPGNPSNRPRR